jgi:hypothetical protein
MAQTTTTIQHDDTKAVNYKVAANSPINEYSMVGRFNTMHSHIPLSRVLCTVLLILKPTASIGHR